MVRRIIISLFIMIAIVSINSVEAQITVVGQNNPDVDIQAVQKAVDQGGTIHLKGTFNFGNEGRVNLTKDVQIIGETNHKDPVTKIKGGFLALHSPLPAQLPQMAPGPKITIQSLHFDGALGSAIHLAYSSGTTITGNKITNLKPMASDAPIFGKTGLNYQMAIICGTNLAQPFAARKYLADAFIGIFTITDNDIDLTNDAPTKTMAQGVMIIWTTGVNAQIQRNTIVNCSRNSIEAIENYLDKDGNGVIVLKDNKIVTATEGLPFPTPQTPHGILVGWFLDVSGGLDPQRNIKYIIVSNAIRTRGKNSVGILPFTDGVVIVNNGILSEGTDAISLFIPASNGYIAYNKMEATSSRLAVMVRPWKPLKGSKNVFVDNDLRQFKSSAVDIVFEKDTCSNFYVGHRCKVSDLGSSNLVQMTK